MFLQRLVADRPRSDGKTSGLNYDYMGIAEFEFGATREARAALAKLMITNNMGIKKVRLFEKFGISTSKPIEVYIFGEKAYINTLGTRRATAPKLGDFTVETYKTSMRHDDEKIVGWMTVRAAQPLLILRVSQDNLDRADQFLNIFIDGILEEEDKARKQKVYRYTNGWSLRLMAGSVQTSDRFPVGCCKDQWILFDETDKMLERYDYFHEHAERRHRFIGEPIPVDETTYLDDEPNPNNSDGLSNAALRERTAREYAEGRI